MSSYSLKWALPIAMPMALGLSAQWYRTVSQYVPEPYLDEFFHVPQAQRYCSGDYTWDPKITTPPGLYIVAKLFKPLIGCETSSLRSLNVGALCLICILAYNILRKLRSHDKTTQAQGKSTRDGTNFEDSTALSDAHAALNIFLFPPLFFFSAMFYTDVLSTLAVLLSYSAMLTKSSHRGSLYDIVNAVAIGVVALLFRQTNIFWVAVFPAGLSLVGALKNDCTTVKRSEKTDAGTTLRKSWEEGYVHDCAIQDAHLQDYAMLLISIGIAALSKPILVLRVVIPYLTLLFLFAAFVAWNGSVVLGDKSAHTATIHIPQMLYIWPYFAFFSAPLMLGPSIQVLIAVLPSRFQDHLKMGRISGSKPTFLGLPVAIFLTVVALAAVHFNTIIHPYTLADNRHYVFYVFRIIRRHPAIRYLAVPIYYACAWLTWQGIASTPNSEEALRHGHVNARPTSNTQGRPPCHLSFITVWLITTALSVITAPLIEPRYFIIPWIIWRLHVPSRPASFPNRSFLAWHGYDMSLALETVWLLAINAAITYLFIYRPFTWPSEPGKLQRFMW